MIVPTNVETSSSNEAISITTRLCEQIFGPLNCRVLVDNLGAFQCYKGNSHE